MDVSQSSGSVGSATQFSEDKEKENEPSTPKDLEESLEEEPSTAANLDKGKEK